MEGLNSGVDGQAPTALDLVGMLEYWLRDLFPKAVAADAALKDFHGMSESFKICPKFLEKEKTCSDGYSLSGEAVKAGKKFTMKTNPFAFKEGDKFKEFFDGLGTPEEVSTILL